MADDEPINEWVSAKKAAEILGIGPRTLYRYIDHQGLKAYRMGRLIRIMKTDLEAFIEQSKIRPGDLAHLYADHNIY